MARLLASLVAILLALLGLVGWFGKTQYDSARDLRTANKTLTEAAERAQARAKADRKVLVARQAEIASQARKTAEAQQALSEALQRNKEWSDTNVPTDVQKALGGDSGGSAPGL